MIALLMPICLATALAAGIHGGPAAPHEIVVRGTIELSPAEADSTALAAAADKLRELALHRAHGVMEGSAPFWLPGFIREQVLQRWLARFDPTEGMRVLGQDRAEHDHGSLGTSYRTTLRVAVDAASLDRALARLRRTVPAAADAFAVKCAAVAGFWAVLAVVFAWLDRLSRGYMTWRLRAIGALLGIVLPAIVLLIL